MEESVEGLIEAQQGLRDRFADFHRALGRRDEEAYRVALTDLNACLRRWTEGAERALLPALGRTTVPGRDAQRELRLECVQVRELTRYLLSQVEERAPISDILGLTENLDRRLSAHELEMREVYFPAAATVLTTEEWRILAEACAPP